MKIVINGGHYPGVDNGAVGDRVTEAEIDSMMMRLVGRQLRAAGFDVLEIQENDLKKIVDCSNDFGADLFIALHCNASVNHVAMGTEVHYHGRQGKMLAGCIQKQIVDVLKTTDRGIKQSENLYVLKYTDCLAVLAEMAFISNRDDEELLMYHKDDFACAIVQGIKDYLNSSGNII